MLATPDVRIVPAAIEHARALAPRLQPLDIAEVWAQAGMTPLAACEVSVLRSTSAWAGLIDGEVACLFGVSERSMLLSEAIPWLLAAEMIHRHRMLFLRRSREVVAEWQKRYSRLSGFVDERHTLSIAWLRWLGFTFGEAEPRGPFRLPFFPFELRRHG